MKLERMKSERSSWTWKIELKFKTFQLIWKEPMKLESSIDMRTIMPEITSYGNNFQLRRNFPSSEETFQFRSFLSNWNRNFATSDFPTYRSQLTCPFQQHVSQQNLGQHKKYWARTMDHGARLPSVIFQKKPNPHLASIESLTLNWPKSFEPKIADLPNRSFWSIRGQTRPF